MNTARWLTNQLPPKGRDIFTAWEEKLRMHPTYYSEMDKYAKVVLSATKYAAWSKQLKLSLTYRRFKTILRAYSRYQRGEVTAAQLPAGYLKYIEWYHSLDIEEHIAELRRMITPKRVATPEDRELDAYIDSTKIAYSPRALDVISHLNRTVDEEVLVDFVGAMPRGSIATYMHTTEFKMACATVAKHYYVHHGEDMPDWLAYAYPHLLDVHDTLDAAIATKDIAGITQLVIDIRRDRYDEPNVILDIMWLERDMAMGMYW